MALILPAMATRAEVLIMTTTTMATVVVMALPKIREETGTSRVVATMAAMVTR